MSLTQVTVVENYIRGLGLLTSPEGGILRDRLDAQWSALRYLHLLSWDWPFMEKANYELTVISGTSIPISPSGIILIKGARLTTATTPTTGMPVLEFVSKEYYDVYFDRDTTAAKYPPQVAFWANALWTIPAPATVIKITISGILDPSVTGLALNIPDYHEEAFFRLFDWKLSKGDPKFYAMYEGFVKSLGGKQLVDAWGNPAAGI